MEPLSVGVHSVANLGGFRSGQSIAIFGCGPVGLLCMAVAKALGAQRIIAVDIVPQRLEFAKSYAATDTYLPPKPLEGETKFDYSKRNAEQMKQQLNIQDRSINKIDLVIDASGAEVSIQTAIYIVKTGGTFVQVCSGIYFFLNYTLITFSRLVWVRQMSPSTSASSWSRSSTTKAPSVMAYAVYISCQLRTDRGQSLVITRWLSL